MIKAIVGLGFTKGGKHKNEIKKIIEEHIKMGAGEFFCGYNPSYWSNKFGYEVSPNGRFSEHEQITDLESLKEIISEVHKHKKIIFANINAWYYTSETEKEIKQILDDYITSGIDGFIVGSTGILEYLLSISTDYKISEKGSETYLIINGKKIKINISTIMAVYNTEAIKFFIENYPINKVILSREITLKEIEFLVSSFPKMTFEVFGEGDFCRYNNGLCYAEHKYGERDICTLVLNNWKKGKKFREDFRKIIGDKSIKDIEKFELFDNSFLNEIEKINRLKDEFELNSSENIKQELLQLISLFLKKHIYIDYDSLESPFEGDNKSILTLIILKNKLKTFLKKEDLNRLEELEEKYISGKKDYLNKIKTVLSKGEIKEKLLDGTYNRNNYLNLYSYLFFSKFKNIDTIKFPTRGRNYSEKLKELKSLFKDGKVNLDKYNYIDLSKKRTHYDLDYILKENGKY